LIVRGKYHEAFDKSYYAIIKKPHKAHKYKSDLITSFELSNENDIAYIKRELRLGSDNFYKYNDIIEGILNRNNKIVVLARYSNMKDLIENTNIPKVDDLRSVVSAKAYEYYSSMYNSWREEILLGNKTNARNAWSMVDGMRKFNPKERDYDSLYNELKLYGTIYTLIMTTNHSDYKYIHSFYNSIETLNEPLMVYDIDQEKYNYDRVLEVYIEDMDPGREYKDVSTRSVSKRIQVGEQTENVEVEVPQPCKQETVTVTECDSTFTKIVCVPQPSLKKIEQRIVPIFQDVHATIEDHTIVKEAIARVSIYLEDINAGELLFKKQEDVRHYYSDSQKTYSGDSRALDVHASSFVSLSCPSDQHMIAVLQDKINDWTIRCMKNNIVKF
jgi:hypothetical protein